MKKETKGRVFNFPNELWEKIDQDAKRCRRSSTKQVEAILLSHYKIENVELIKTEDPKKEKK